MAFFRADFKRFFKVCSIVTACLLLAQPVYATGFTSLSSFDLDGNGAIGFGDLPTFVAAFGSSEGDGNFRAALDFNADGTINDADRVILSAFFGRSVLVEGDISLSGADIAVFDLDGNGSVGFGDVAIFAQALGSILGDDRFQFALDFNRDGLINERDADILGAFFGRVVPESTPEEIRFVESFDFDENGVIGLNDLVALASVFNAVEGDDDFDARFDLNEDGVVDLEDVALLVAELGTSANGEGDSPEAVLEVLEAELADIENELAEREEALATTQLEVEASRAEEAYLAQQITGLDETITETEASVVFNDFLINFLTFIVEDIQSEDSVLLPNADDSFRQAIVSIFEQFINIREQVGVVLEAELVRLEQERVDVQNQLVAQQQLTANLDQQAQDIGAEIEALQGRRAVVEVAITSLGPNEAEVPTVDELPRESQSEIQQQLIQTQNIQAQLQISPFAGLGVQEEGSLPVENTGSVSP